MRGRVAVLLLSLSFFSLFSSTAVADCWTPRASAQLRSSMLDVALDGNDLWAATSYGVELYDRSVDPPRLIDSIAVPGTTRGVQPAGNGIVWAGSGARIYVIRKNGKSLEIVRSVDTGATVNDLLYSTYLFVATTNGLGHYDVFDPLKPARTSAILPTSSANVTGLAVNGTTLYAADNDSSLELFNISSPAIPQHTSTIDTLPRASSVHVANQRIYVSDGLSTDIISGTTRIGRIAVPSSELITLGNDEQWVAGNDRTLRAVDFATPGTPIVLWERELIPNGGTINGIFALQTAANRLYVAAGDAGLLTYDTSSFTRPYLIHDYRLGTPNGLAMNGSTLWFGAESGGISERLANSNGTLSAVRTWDPGTIHRVEDFANGALLTTRAETNTLTSWNVAPSTPVPFWTATMPGQIVDARFAGDSAYALFANNTVWKTTAGAAAQQVDTGGAKIVYLASSGSAAVFVEQQEDAGKSVLHYFATPNSARQSVTLNGSVTSVAMNGNTVAAFTFEGINLVTFPAGAVSVLSGSNNVFPEALAFDGSTLLELTSRRLYVWDTDARKMTRTMELFGFPFSLAASNGVAVIGTAPGFMSVSYRNASSAPQALSGASGNRFALKVTAGENRAYVLTRNGVDIYSTQFGFAPAWLGSVVVPGIVDVAATDTGFTTAVSNGTVTSWSPSGAIRNSVKLLDPTDQQVIALNSVGGVAWLSYSRGCASAACQNETAVLDSTTLAVTSTMSGAVKDVVTDDLRAYALFEQPDELRVFDTNDAQHPVLLVSRALTATAVSVAHRGSTVYLLGTRLTPYDEATLTPGEPLLDAATTNFTQRVRIEGDCAIVTGRTFDPQLYSASNWSAMSGFELPSSVRSVATQPGRLLLLTEHSLEVWSVGDAPAPRKRRAAR